MTRRTARRLTTAGVALVVMAAGAITTTRVRAGSGSHRTASSKSATTATVQRMDVAETTPVSGTVGFANPYTIVQPAGTAPQAVTQAQQSVAQARLALFQAQETLDQGKVAAAQLALSSAQTTLATAVTAATMYDPTSKYTALPAVGDVINPGQSMWSVDGRRVPLLPGGVTPWRAFAPGMSPGADVAALNHALAQLGFGNGLPASDTFTGATAGAIDRLQATLALPRSGTLPLGSAVFSPTAVRVTAVHPLVGSSVGGGQPVLDVSSTTPVVNVALPVSQTSRVKVGDPVSVNLPDGTIGAGTITAVGTVASNTTPPNSGSTTTSATVNVVVSLTNATPAGSLDQAPVTVNITNNSAHQVLAVPTTAVLALAGGGYAVEVMEPDGTHRLVGVTIGIFDDQSGLVEVSGSGLTARQRVVVAS